MYFCNESERAIKSSGVSFLFISFSSVHFDSIQRNKTDQKGMVFFWLILAFTVL